MDKNKLKEKSKSLKGLFLVFSVLLFFYLIDWGFLFGKITAYSLRCPEDYPEGKCYPLTTTEYYPSSRNQTVRSKGSLDVVTYKKCSVINRKNWECKYDDESGTFGFLNGEFHSYALKDPIFLDKTAVESWERETSYVGRIRYLLEVWYLL